MKTEKLELTQIWDKVFPRDERTEHCKVTFANRYGITLAAVMKLFVATAALASLLALAGCAQGAASPSAGASSASVSSAAVSAERVDSFVIGVGDAQLAVTLADTDAARALVQQLQAGPVTVSLHAYGGFEKVGPLPWSLPTSDEQITTQPGDVMLYQGDQITVFTGTNSWAYTLLGHIEGATPESLLEALGDDDVEITLSLA